ncbi:hypothetical protein TNCV_3446071 [Trichonephila clavipes]|nr:hypothetical protein TNCV_3446071 [Trichonephila clavipes]
MPLATSHWRVTNFAHSSSDFLCGPKNGPVLPDLSRDKGLSNIWAIIRPGNTFPPKAASVTLLGTKISYSDWLRQGGAEKDYVSSIMCSDTQASVRHEINKRGITSKPFSQTVHMFYASSGKGEPPVPFIDT